MKRRLKEIKSRYSSYLRRIQKNDFSVFKDIAIFSKQNLYFAKKIAKMTIDTMVAQPPSARINFYYAIDNIVKHVGANYTSIFEKLLIKQFPKDLKAVPKSGKKAFLILFLSWEVIFSVEACKLMLKNYYLDTGDVTFEN